MTDANLQEVDSSAIAKLAYDEKKETLHVLFKSNGKAFSYFDVPVEVYRALLGAESIGRYFAREIKPVFAWQEIGREDDVLELLKASVVDRKLARERMDQIARQIDRSGIRAVTF